MPAMRPRARFLEFFAANIRNKNTRMADYWAVYQLFAWCDRHRIAVDAVPVADSRYPPTRTICAMPWASLVSVLLTRSVTLANPIRGLLSRRSRNQ